MSTQFRFPEDAEFRSLICWAPIARTRWGQKIKYLDVRHKNNSIKPDWSRYLSEFCALFPEVKLLQADDRTITVRFEDLEDNKDWNQAYGLATLLRYIEEQPQCIAQYITFREFMPPDTAFLLASSGVNFALFHAHAFLFSLSTLQTLKDFSIRQAFLENCDNEIQMSTGKVLSVARPWFGSTVRWASNFIFIPEIYTAFNTATPDYSYIDALIEGQRYNYKPLPACPD